MKLTDFQQELRQINTPVIVDLWAPWCAPCRTTKPLLEKLAREFEGEVTFLAINADESPEVARHYRVLAIPTVLSFRGEELVTRVTGAQNEDNYRRLFEAARQGETVKLPISTFDRLLRLGAGTALIGVAFLTSNVVIALAGAALAFLGVYDRCPMVRTFTNLLAQRRNN